jgi:hypothetical protein
MAIEGFFDGFFCGLLKGFSRFIEDYCEFFLWGSFGFIVGLLDFFESFFCGFLENFAEFFF